jgi:hypothetical protein
LLGVTLIKALRRTLLLGCAVTVLFLPGRLRAGPPSARVEAQTSPEGAESPPPQAVETPAPPAIAPGTVITKSNWMQYRQFFSEGEIGLWEGRWFWKMPDDVQINVGPTRVYPLPEPFIELTERYGEQTQLIKLPSGRWQVKNYVSGMPFAIPSEPNMGLKILTNVYHRIGPHLIAGFRDSGTPNTVCNMDRFNDVLCWKFDYDIRQMAYNWEPGVPRVEKDAGGAWLGVYIDVVQPEQYRYTADLILWWQDNLRLEDNYLFIPALRRSLRVSDASHCSPIFTFSDLSHDDIWGGWFGGIADFDASFVKRMKLLALTGIANNDFGNFPENYDMPLGWARPSWGQWELRNVWVIDVRPIAPLAPKYCYAKRTMYVDSSLSVPLAQDVYDSRMSLSKIIVLGAKSAEIPAYGTQTWAGGGIQQVWNVKNDHAVMGFTADARGRNWTIDSAVKPKYDNISAFQTASGVLHQMR